MGTLTGYLQEQFRIRVPREWECGHEARLLSVELAGVLGYAPRADVVLSHCANNSRLWIEFEVSRADPVANHAKFATAHIFCPQSPDDIFVSMVSRHVDRGRRNLAANTIHLMRRLGMNAVQTVLLPNLAGPEIQRLNQMSANDLRGSGPDVGPEIERVMAVTVPQGVVGDHRIYLAGELVEVLLNARSWNEEIAAPRSIQTWRRRRVRYFVYVPYSGQFAPCKFCAFMPVRQPGVSGTNDLSRMTLDLYAQLDESETRFDGHIARLHLINRLGMVEIGLDGQLQIAEEFRGWRENVAEHVIVDSRGPRIIIPPKG